MIKENTVPDFYMAPQALPLLKDGDAMVLEVEQLDSAAKRFFGGVGWKTGRSGVAMPPGVAGVEATATGGACFAVAEPPKKKPKTGTKPKKKFFVNGVKKFIEAGDHKKMSESELQAYEAERAKDGRGEWPEKWPPKRIAAVQARVQAARGGVEEFLCLD